MVRKYIGRGQNNLVIRIIIMKTPLKCRYLFAIKCNNNNKHQYVKNK